jgi:SAM-dependent methyltransferase
MCFMLQSVEMEQYAQKEQELNAFFHQANGFAFSQAIAAAVESNVFGFLSKHPNATLEQIAEDCKLPRLSARALMLSMVYLGLVDREAGAKTYRNKPSTERLLVPTSPENVIPLVRAFWRIQYKGLYHMPTALKQGTNLGVGDPTAGGGEETLYKRIAHDPELEKIFHDAMSCFTRQTNQHLVKFSEWNEVAHVLDVGGGTGTNSFLLAKSFPKLKMTVFDAPTICDRALARFKEEGVAERCGVHHGEFFKDPFPKGIDGILFSHVAEIYAPDQVEFICKKSYDALPPGGKLLLWVIAASDAEDGGLWAVKISLYFLTQASGGGITYPADDYDPWLKKAGFTQVKKYKNLPWEHAFIVATK